MHKNGNTIKWCFVVLLTMSAAYSCVFGGTYLICCCRTQLIKLRFENVSKSSVHFQVGRSISSKTGVRIRSDVEDRI
ncbi:hypothetical protein EDD15DRAFT_2289133 [Pisolithus albus]|nr:hypothetical protein EDD15DRAFT_2289133 [Pisolithus albus]